MYGYVLPAHTLSQRSKCAELSHCFWIGDEGVPIVAGPGTANGLQHTAVKHKDLASSVADASLEYKVCAISLKESLCCG